MIEEDVIMVKLSVLNPVANTIVTKRQLADRLPDPGHHGSRSSHVRLQGPGGMYAHLRDIQIELAVVVF